MVMCERGFRLSGVTSATSAESTSSVSLYKQKIDALFDDNRSIASYGHNHLSRKSSKVSSTRSKKASVDSNGSVNSVQDRIEKMFAEMAIDTKNGPADGIGHHSFTVHYLGSIQLSNKVAGLSGLQGPLKDLYFAYRKTAKPDSKLQDTLEISKNGLKIVHSKSKEQINPFPTIAVWSAVKFSLQASEKDNSTLQFAFLPLITDPHQIDKQAIFTKLDSKDKPYILASTKTAHSPIFAVVMRKIGATRLLECHAFVCQTSDDAIVIAATLYKTLMAHMTKENNRVKSKNGISCMSHASSQAIKEDIKPVRPPRKKRSTSSQSGESDIANVKLITERDKPKQIKTRKGMNDPLPPPPPPPNVDKRKVKLEKAKNVNELNDNGNSNEDSIVNTNSDSSIGSKVSEKIELFSQMEKRKNLQRPPTLPPPIPKSIESNEPLKRKQSLRKSVSDSGDIMTKIAIPRSGSFLNAGGLTRYKSIGDRNNGKKGGGSPLGFHELFNEFKVQENLHSMDEILNAIINAEGMSFNDLKPIYKEFLLKLAVTLTKDELFQHSKAIMKRQKKKIIRRNSTFQKKRKKMLKGAYGLRMVFRKPFGKSPKLSNETKDIKYEFNNVKTMIKTESSVSTSSYDLKQFRPKEPELPPPKRLSVRKRNSKRSEKVIHVTKRGRRPGERTSTSEDSDFRATSARLASQQNRNSSSGYVSCSECESERCANKCYCSVKADCPSKCYCSAGELKNQISKKSRPRPKVKCCKDCTGSKDSRCYDMNCDFSYIDCDSDTCNESGKCYCRSIPPKRISASIKSTKSIEYIARKQYCERMSKAFEEHLYDPMKNKSFRIRSNSSLGYNYMERRYTQGVKGVRSRSVDNLAMDYQLLFDKGLNASYKKNTKRLTVRSSGGQEALSVKKSAEMAALFADVHLSQRTDVRNLLSSATVKTSNVKTTNINVYRSGVYASSQARRRPVSRKPSLEDTLGYLP